MNETIEIKSLKKDELLALADLYAKAGETVAPEGTDISKLKKDELVAILQEKADTIGTPHEVTESDIDTNGAAWPADMKVGDVVILPKPEKPPETIYYQCEEDKTKWGGVNTPSVCPVCEKAGTVITAEAYAGEEKKPEAPKKPQKEDATVAAPVQLYYNRRAVISVDTKLVNGKTYKEVVCADSTSLLTEEEFSKFVTRNA